MKKILFAILLTIGSLLATAAKTGPYSKRSFFTAKDSALLDSIQRIVDTYEKEGDYMAAYAAESEYLRIRAQIKKERLSSLLERQLKDSKSNDIDIANLELKKQNAQMELDILGSKYEMMKLKYTKDSIDLQNDKLMRDNWQYTNELQGKQIQKEEEARRRLIVQNNMRLIGLIGIILLTLIIIGLCTLQIKRLSKGYKEMKAEKKVVDDALQKAREAERAHDEFMHNLSDEIRDPLEALTKATHENADAACNADRRGDNMMKIHISTDKLINIVNKAIDKIETSSGDKIMLPILLLFFVLPSMAQNNPYGLRDDLYKFYLECDRDVQSPGVLAKADSLMKIAQRENNTLLECLAYDVKVGHSFFLNDVNKIHAAQQEMLAFVRTTKHTDYIFYALNRSIIFNLNNMNFVEAGEEIRAYQKEALRLNNSYGIVKGYYYMGELYRKRGMDKEAIEQYKNSIDKTAESGSKAGISYSYCRIGEIYLANKSYDKAEKYLKMAAKTKVHDYELANPTVFLFMLYVQKRDVESATKYKAILEKMDKEKLISGKRHNDYMSALVRYDLLIGDEEKARMDVKSMGNYDYETSAAVYAALGDYKTALKLLQDGVNDTRQQEKTMDLAQILALQNDYERSRGEIQNSKLALENTLLSLEQAKRQNELSEERNMQDSVRLSNNKLQKMSQTTSDSIMAAERSIMEETLKREELAIKNRRNIALITGLLLFFLLAFLIGDNVRRRHSTKRLAREKADAIEACKLAEEAAERKKLFLEQVTHEIRTPLNAVVGFNQILCDDAICSSLGQDDINTFCQQSSEGMESLSRIVDTALELSDLESGRCKAKKETTDVNAICDELVKKYSTRAHNGVSVSCTGEEVQPIVTDGEKLNKALSVLMNNACKFTYNGSIQLERHINGELLELSVTDTGCGIPADKSDNVFKNFYKVDSFVPGIGLGLPLCRSLTHLLGGEVSLDKSYTNGCRFTIKLVCG